MPKQFQDLAELLAPHLDLPIRGKVYQVESPDVKVGLRAQATVAIATAIKANLPVTSEEVASLKLDDDEEKVFVRSMLGATLDEMTADKVPWEYVNHAAKTVFMWLVQDRDAAATVWASLGKAPKKVPQDRRASGGRTKTESSRKSSTRKTSPTPD